LIPKIKHPFFILGNPRSGTTLVRLMFDANPLITVPPECGFAVWFFNKYKIWKELENAKNISDFIKDLKTAKKIDTWNLNFKKLNEQLLQSNPKSYSELINNIYIYYALNQNKTIELWGDKNNFYINHIKEITSIFPEARFIHLVRDGRDVACSYKELGNKNIISNFAPKLPTDIKDIANEWKTNNEVILRDLFQYSNEELYLTVKYEDLILENEPLLRNLCNFLDINFHENMLEHYNYSKSYEPNEYMQWKTNTDKPLLKNRINRYKKELTEHEIEDFTKLAGSTLKRFDYEL
jgi:hypothetical protein